MVFFSIEISTKNMASSSRDYNIEFFFRNASFYFYFLRSVYFCGNCLDKNYDFIVSHCFASAAAATAISTAQILCFCSRINKSRRNKNKNAVRKKIFLFME